MKEINLREYYPFYNMDVYLEVTDEIAGQLDRFKLDEEAHRVRVLRAKAYFSLDRGDGIEKDALQKPPQPLELILKAEQAARLDAALRSLNDLPAPSDSGVLSGWQEQIADCKRGKCQRGQHPRKHPKRLGAVEKIFEKFLSAPTKSVCFCTGI